MRFFSNPKRAARFRKKPLALLEDDLASICKRYGFFDRYYNPDGEGIANQIKLKKYDGDKVVIDNAAGLMWQQGGSTEEMEYEDAKKWLEELNKKGYASFHDWWLPTLEEAMSLMEPEKKNGDLYIDPMFDAKQRWIWTSDKVQGMPRAWDVSFGSGGCYHGLYSISYVRAVRSGQSSGG